MNSRGRPPVFKRNMRTVHSYLHNQENSWGHQWRIHRLPILPCKTSWKARSFVFIEDIKSTSLQQYLSQQLAIFIRKWKACVAILGSYVRLFPLINGTFPFQDLGTLKTLVVAAQKAQKRINNMYFQAERSSLVCCAHQWDGRTILH